MSKSTREDPFNLCKFFLFRNKFKLLFLLGMEGTSSLQCVYGC